MSLAQQRLSNDRHLISEALEQRAHQDMFDAAPESVRRAVGWRCEKVGAALVSVAENVPSILLNRTLGLGVATPATREHVREICRRYADAGIERFFVQVSPQAGPPALKRWLAEEGLTPQRRWMKFERDARPAPQVPTALRIAPVEQRHATAFGRIVADAFDLGETAAGIFAPLVGREGWHVFGAFDGDRLAGVGALFVYDGYGYLGYGATLPEQRGKGAQSAVLAARVAKARELGCIGMDSETGEEVPGEPQHSYHNIERAGFEPVYLRDNYAPPKRSP